VLGVILATTTLIAVMGVTDGMEVYIAQQVSTRLTRRNTV